MIKLWDGYVIDGDEYNYTLGIPKSRVNAKGETETSIDKASYHSSVGSALLAFARKKQREYIKSNDVTLQEAVEAFYEIEARINGIGKATVNVQDSGTGAQP